MSVCVSFYDSTPLARRLFPLKGTIRHVRGFFFFFVAIKTINSYLARRYVRQLDGRILHVVMRVGRRGNVTCNKESRQNTKDAIYFLLYFTSHFNVLVDLNFFSFYSANALIFYCCSKNIVLDMFFYFFVNVFQQL